MHDAAGLCSMLSVACYKGMQGVLKQRNGACNAQQPFCQGSGRNDAIARAGAGSCMCMQNKTVVGTICTVCKILSLDNAARSIT